MIYTVFVGPPKLGVETSPFILKENCVNQTIAFDGPLTKAEAVKIAKVAEQYFTWVQLFAGKTLGKLVLELPEVCSVCKVSWDKHEWPWKLHSNNKAVRLLSK